VGKWATYQRRGGGGQASAPLPIPDLVNASEGNVEWSVVGVTPDLALLQHGPTDSGPWSLDLNPPWADGSADVTFVGDWYRVTGTDSFGNPVTQPSASVLVT